MKEVHVVRPDEATTARCLGIGIEHDGSCIVQQAARRPTDWRLRIWLDSLERHKMGVPDDQMTCTLLLLVLRSAAHYTFPDLVHRDTGRNGEIGEWSLRTSRLVVGGTP